jgi:hypothetical protein
MFIIAAKELKASDCNVIAAGNNIDFKADYLAIERVAKCSAVFQAVIGSGDNSAILFAPPFSGKSSLATSLEKFIADVNYMPVEQHSFVLYATKAYVETALCKSLQQVLDEFQADREQGTAAIRSPKFIIVDEVNTILEDDKRDHYKQFWDQVKAVQAHKPHVFVLLLSTYTLAQVREASNVDFAVRFDLEFLKFTREEINEMTQKYRQFPVSARMDVTQKVQDALWEFTLGYCGLVKVFFSRGHQYFSERMINARAEGDVTEAVRTFTLHLFFFLIFFK